MIPPMAPVTGFDAPVTAAPAALLPCLTVLTQRADFVKASKGLRHAAPGFHLQARRREADEPAGIRVGFTCSKKVGNAVARNRAKRRLREITRLVLPRHGREGWDYVLVGRAGATATVDFARMTDDLRHAVDRLHRGHA